MGDQNNCLAVAVAAEAENPHKETCSLRVGQYWTDGL